MSPRVRRGPNGPKRSLAGKQGSNKATPHKGAGTSGQGHNSAFRKAAKRPKGY